MQSFAERRGGGIGVEPPRKLTLRKGGLSSREGSLAIENTDPQIADEKRKRLKEAKHENQTKTRNLLNKPKARGAAGGPPRTGPLQKSREKIESS